MSLSIWKGENLKDVFYREDLPTKKNKMYGVYPRM